MTDHTMNVNICTPDGTVYDGQATMAVVNTKNGQIGILPNHIPLVATLEIDEVRIKHDDDEDTIAVNGGFIEFSDNTATIVADSAELPNAIDVKRAQEAQKRAEEHLHHAQEAHDKDEYARAEVALKRAVNRLHVTNKRI